MAHPHGPARVRRERALQALHLGARMDEIAPEPPRRLPTGIPGLDRITCGGLLRGGLYVITGETGTGKTVLANQLCFAAVAAGERAVYLTLWSEPLGRMLSNTANFSFFDPQVIPSNLQYFSGVQALEEAGVGGGYKPLLDLLRRLAREHRASVVVIDSFAALLEAEQPSHAPMALLRELGTAMSLSGCTTLLVSPIEGDRPHPEYLVADGVLRLERHLIGVRGVRHLEVVKFRGSGHLDGRHVTEITQDGLRVHPRLEATAALSAPGVDGARGLARFGVAGIDDMLGGGLLDASATVVLGAPGSGKTVLGLHFLAEGLRAGEPCVYLGFNETPPRVEALGAGVGLDLARHRSEGRLELHWAAPLEGTLDPIAERLLDAVERLGARRAFLDGFEGLEQMGLFPERLPLFVTALTNLLRARGVSLIVARETTLLGQEVLEAQFDLSASFDTVILLRYVERGARLHRLLTLLKVRARPYDPSIRELKIGAGGASVGTAGAAERLLRRATPIGAPGAGERDAPTPPAARSARGKRKGRRAE